MIEINCNPENISNRIGADLDLTLARNLNKELECKLQQLKAENEELKDKKNSIHSIADGLQQRNHNLILENEKLKEQKDDYCFDCDVAERMRKLVWYVTDGRMSYANYTYEAMTQVYDEVLDEKIKPYKNKLEKAENCLNEIEEIVNLKTCNGCPYDKQCTDDRYSTCEEIQFTQISQLIKQVKEGGE